MSDIDVFSGEADEIGFSTVPMRETGNAAVSVLPKETWNVIAVISDSYARQPPA